MAITGETRIVDLPEKVSLVPGDFFVVDNENGATSKIPAAAVSGSATAGLVAEEYSNASTYAVGEYCIHVESGIPKLYRCTTAITTAETWNSAHWSQTDAGSELTTANEDIATLNQNLTELESALGTVVTDGNASVTLPASTYTNIASVQLGKGVWIITSLLQIGASIAGVYIHQLLAGSSELSLVRNNGQNGGGSSNATIVTLSATTTITLRAYIGTATTAKGSITAVRIK